MTVRERISEVPPLAPIYQRALKVEGGRVVVSLEYDAETRTVSTRRDMTRVGINITPPDGTYLHLEMVKEILAQAVQDMGGTDQFPGKFLAQDLLDDFTGMSL